MKVSQLFEARKQVAFDMHQQSEKDFTNAWEMMSNSWDNVTPEIVAKMKEAMKNLNRADAFYAGKDYRRQGTFGGIYDRAVIELKKKSVKAGGKVEFPTGKESTVRSFAEHLALAFPGVRTSTRSYFARVWTVGGGYGKYKDPEYGIEVFNKQDFDDMWEEMKKHGVVIHVKFPISSSLTEVVKFGKYIVHQNTKVRNAFGDEPETEWHFEIQTTGVFKNSIIKKVEITPQEANRLNDLAATKNAAAMAGIKAILDHFKSEEEAKAAIKKAKDLEQTTRDVLNDIIEKSKGTK